MCDDQIPHSANDRSCPAYIKEQETVRIKYTRNISFKEARSAYDAEHPRVTYATRVKSTNQIHNNTHPHTSQNPMEQISAAQRIALLRSFGLTVVQAPVEPGAPSAGVGTGSAIAAARPAAAQPSRAEPPVSHAQSARPGPPADDRGRTTSGPPTPAAGGAASPAPRAPPPFAAPGLSPAPSSGLGEHAAETLERQEIARRAREANRARLAAQEKAKAAGGSGERTPAPRSASASPRRRVEAPPGTSVENPGRRMGPPPPPPPRPNSSKFESSPLIGGRVERRGEASSPSNLRQ